MYGSEGIARSRVLEPPRLGSCASTAPRENHSLRASAAGRRPPPAPTTRPSKGFLLTVFRFTAIRVHDGPREFRPRHESPVPSEKGGAAIPADRRTARRAAEASARERPLAVSLDKPGSGQGSGALIARLSVARQGSTLTVAGIGHARASVSASASPIETLRAIGWIVWRLSPDHERGQSSIGDPRTSGSACAHPRGIRPRARRSAAGILGGSRSVNAATRSASYGDPHNRRMPALSGSSARVNRRKTLVSGNVGSVSVCRAQRTCCR